MDFAQVIKDSRNLSGLTQQQLADALKTTRGTVQGWERGVCPQQRHMTALADLFGRDAVEFVRPFRPRAARKLMSETDVALLGEDPQLVSVEPDPFAWRLRQVLAWRDLDPWVFGARLGISAKTTRRWLAGRTVPGWEGLWRAADLLDVPVWWWRCGGEDEQAMFGPYELRGSDETWPGHEYAWAFSRDAADRYDVPVADIIRTTYPDWAGWRWRGRLGEWRPEPALDCPVTARVRLAVLAWCAEQRAEIDDAVVWVTDVSGVHETTVRRWFDGQRKPRFEEAALLGAGTRRNGVVLLGARGGVAHAPVSVTTQLRAR